MCVAGFFGGNMGIKVGIDLGTTFSAVARINPASGKPEIIKNSFNSPVTPSVLYFNEDGSVLFGEEAKEMQAMGDMNTAAFFKRSMGREYVVLDFYGKSYTATDLSALFLKKLVQEAENSAGEKIESAVITVPAYFTHKERQATIEAGRKAGLNVQAVINEPTAAVLAYGLNTGDTEQTVLIYDLGGGTFDVTIARISKDKIDILGSDGNHELGGKDWDDCIARYLARYFREQYDVDLSDDEAASAALHVTAESVKKQLTSRDEVKVPIVSQGVHGSVTITEEQFEDITGYLTHMTSDLIDSLLKSLNMTWNDITGTILVGGSTRMRMIREFVKKMSGREPLAGVNVDEAVALGAAVRANMEESYSIGGGQGGLYSLPGAKQISDVTAHALGMIAINGDGSRYINSVIIPKNTSIPAKQNCPYSFATRAKDNELEVYVLQGSFERPLDNVVLDKYVITGIEHVNTRKSVIDVSYSYTADGIVEVSAVQKETGRALNVRTEKVPEDMSWTDLPPQSNRESVEPDAAVMLAVDLSGSMSGFPLHTAKKAIEKFVKQMSSVPISIGLMAFSDSTRVIIPPTRNYRDVLEELIVLRVGLVGGGNDAEPFTEAYRVLHSEDPDAIRYLIVLTDGVWNKPKYAKERARMCHSGGIEIMALGFGEADYNFLKSIASTDDYASLTELTSLSGSFSKIAQTISQGTGLRMN
jgi:molecular chaperone DnaK (HSP70)/uncharacterized protein YegL